MTLSGNPEHSMQRRHTLKGQARKEPTASESCDPSSYRTRKRTYHRESCFRSLPRVRFAPYSQETDKVNQTQRQTWNLKYKDGQTTKNHQAIGEDRHGDRSIKFTKERKYRKDMCEIFY